MSFRALCPHCDVASRYAGDWRGRTLECANPSCGRAFVAEFVVEEPATQRQFEPKASSLPSSADSRGSGPAGARWAVKCGGYDLLTWIFGQDDVEADRDRTANNATEWAWASSTSMILMLFLAVLVCAIGVFVYRVIELSTRP